MFLRFFICCIICSLYCEAANLNEVHFYCDKEYRKFREKVVNDLSKGPFRELHAYISCVSDITCLSGCSTAELPSKSLERLLLYTAYADLIGGGQPEFFDRMLDGKGLDRIENTIEFGLKNLSKQTFTAAEFLVCCKFNDMVRDLAESLSEQRQMFFWKKLRNQVTAVEIKREILEAEFAYRPFVKRAYACLTHYHHLMNQALGNKFYGEPFRS